MNPSRNPDRDVGQDGILRADWQSALGVHSSPNPSRKRKRPSLAFYSLPWSCRRQSPSRAATAKER
jgi:hypothetical protein